MTALLDAALSYGARGWYVFPGRSDGKGHAHVKWSTKSTRDPQMIRRYWTQWPNATICLNCGLSGLAVIDLDVKDGADGPATFAALRKIHGAIPPTLRQRTGSGGRHLIFRGDIKTTVGVIGSGIDTRGRGVMIVLAPSIIKGRAYRWIEPQLDIAPLPPWLAELAGVSHHVEQGDGEYEAIYSEQEFRTLLNLIPVSRYDDDHDAWLELMLACSHASTVDDGEDAFMKWTIADGPGNRIGYSSDFDVILARWQYNYAKRNMRGGVKVGTFNRHVLAAAPNALVKSPITAEAQFADDQENEDAADTAALAARWRKLDRQPRAARHRAAVRKQREWIARRPSHIRGGRQ